METKLLSTDRPIAIYYSFPENIESITDQDKNTKAVSFKEGKDWNLINTTIGTIDFQSIPEKTRAGTIHNNNLNASCPGHEENTPDDIAAFSGRKVVFRIDYKSGFKKLIGNLDKAPDPIIETLSNTTTSRKLKFNWKSSTVNYWLA